MTAVEPLFPVSFIGTAPDFTGPWTLEPIYSYIDFAFEEANVVLEYDCGPRYPKCITITDNLNDYQESRTWVPISYDLPGFGKVWSYLPTGDSPSAIGGGDLSFFYASFFAETWVLQYEYYYLSPQPSGFTLLTVPLGGLNNTEISTGTFTYNSYGANVTFEISNDPDYSCFSG